MEVAERERREKLADDIKHRLFLLRMDRGTAEREVAGCVDKLTDAQLKLRDVDKQIKQIQGSCPHHDPEKTGSSPNGSFSINYFRCRVCQHEWNDD
jgi:hypothetical protein